MRIHPLLLAISLALPFTAHAYDDSMLHVTCFGEDVGAVVSINGKFKGKCPIDIKVLPGTLNIRVVKQADAAHERVFEQDIRIGDGVTKKIEAILSAPRLAADGQRLKDLRLADEHTEEQKRKEARLAELPRPKVEQDKQDVDVMRKRDRLFAEIAKGEVKFGQSFRDCAECAEMVVIPAGSFEMGTPEYLGNDAEKPAHQVNIAKPFAMGKTEVTQQQWQAIMGNNPSHFTDCGDSCPVENVNWNDAQEFIKKLNARTGKKYRLPSEAEWEYACRAGGKMEYCGSDEVDNVAWNGSNSGNTIHPTSRKQANAFGLYDMSGNVWEWMEDSWHNNYGGAPAEGRVWQGDGAQRVLRGGSWGDVSQGTRAAIRVGLVPSIRINSNGFRLARMLP